MSRTVEAKMLDRHPGHVKLQTCLDRIALNFLCDGDSMNVRFFEALIARIANVKESPLYHYRTLLHMQDLDTLTRKQLAEQEFVRRLWPSDEDYKGTCSH